MALKKSAAKAGAWTVIQSIWSSAASFLVFSFLIHKLQLADVGLFTLAASYVEIVRVLAGAGLGEALQREPELDDELLNTAFWGGIGLTAIVAVIITLGARWFGALMHVPRLPPLIYALAGLLFVSSLSRVHWALKLREFGHKVQTYQTMISTIIGGVGAVIAVLMGAGVWALLVQGVVSEAVGFVLAWSSHPWRPRLAFKWRRFTHLVEFGGGLVITHMLWTTLARIPDFIIGRAIGVEAVGIYRIAWRLVDLLGTMFLSPLGNITFLSLARLQHDAARFENAYCRVLGLGSLSMLPLVAGLGATAPDLIPTVFGDHTLASVPIAEILAFSAPVFVTNYFISSALSAMGRPYVMGRIAAVQLVSTLVVSLLAAPFGLLAVAAAYVVRGYLTLPYQQFMLRRHTGVRWSRVAETVAVPIAAAAGMALTVVLAQPLLHGLPGGRIVRLAAQIALGGAVYGLLTLLFGRRMLASQLEFARSIIRREPALSESDAAPS